MDRQRIDPWQALKAVLIMVLGLALLIASTRLARGQSFSQAIMAEAYRDAWAGYGFYYNPYASSTTTTTSTTTIITPTQKPTTIINTTTTTHTGFNLPTLHAPARWLDPLLYRQRRGIIYDPCKVQPVRPGTFINK